MSVFAATDGRPVVRIHGLKQRPELNNTLGTVDAPLADPSGGGGESSDRILVSLLDPAPAPAPAAISVRPCNLLSADEAMQRQFTRQARSNEDAELAATLSIAMLDLQLQGRLPDLIGNAFTIIFVGASSRYETERQYTLVYEDLKARYYPALERLDIVLCGPELSAALPKRQSPAIVVSTLVGAMEHAYPGLRAFPGALACMIAPGFTSFLDAWAPGVQRLMSLGIPTLLTCYSDIASVTDDALFDEDALRRYYGANVVVPTSKNPHYSLKGPRCFKNALYTIFQGPVDPAESEVLEPKQYKIKMLAGYMRFQGDFYKAQHAPFGATCYAIAAELESGAMPFNNQTTTDLVLLARNRVTNSY
jgi:hypothetical protein